MKIEFDDETEKKRIYIILIAILIVQVLNFVTGVLK